MLHGVVTHRRKNSVNLKGLLNLQPKQLFAITQARSDLGDSRESSKRGCSSEKEHKVNALAPRADEGRDNLR